MVVIVPYLGFSALDLDTKVANILVMLVLLGVYVAMVVAVFLGKVVDV